MRNVPKGPMWWWTGCGIAFLLAVAWTAKAEESADQEQDPGEQGEDGDEPDDLESLRERLQQLEQELAEVKEQLAEDELRELIERAEMAASAPPEEERPEDRTFVAASQSLQVTNPEISVAGDFLAELVIDDAFRDGEPIGTGMPIRAMSVDIRSVLDPYSTAKIAVEFLPDPEEPVALEEIYITWSGLVPSMSLSVGRFRHEFGVINRWHEHDLDQTMYPLAMRQVIGDEGLSGDGISLKWFMPRLWAHANELRVDVVDGNHPALFSGERFQAPAVLGRLKNYWDLNEATYLELGLSGAFGANNPLERSETRDEATARGADPAAADYEAAMVDQGWGKTVAAGVDLTLFWNPPKRARYRSFTWRSELYYLQKQQETEGWDRGWGVYSYLQFQPGAGWYMGVRGDLAHPIEPEAKPWVWAVTPYVTFWQSEFVFLRLEYGHTQGLGEHPEHRVAFQVSWAAGPHKHEKY